MKLADNYLPAVEKIRDNVIYDHYRVQIDEALRSPGDRDPAREIITSEGFDYRFTPQETEFYEKLYILSEGPTEAGQPAVTEATGGKTKRYFRTGRIERTLIDFTQTDSRLMAVIAPVGYGKTVLLKYVWLYLASKLEGLRRTVLPVYMSVDQRYNELSGPDSPAEIRHLLYELFLKPRLTKVVQPFSGLEQDEFWAFLRKMDDFAYLDLQERALQRIYGIGSSDKDYQRELYQLRREAMSRDSFALCAMKYVVDVKKKIAVLIFDNVDPLSIAIHRTILQEAVRLNEEYRLRIIITMRTSTYNELAADPDSPMDTYPIMPVFVGKRDVRDYVVRRVQTALKGVRTKQFEYIDGPTGTRITHKRAEGIITCMLGRLLSQESIDFLDYITNHNLRKLNDFVRIYLASGYLDVHHLMWSIVEQEATGYTDYQSPLWILLSSILTANHKTHFSTRCPDTHVLRHIVNLFCNRKGNVNRYTIRLYILHLLSRERRISVERLCRVYESILSPENSENWPSNLDHAIHRLLECGLLVSPEYYHIEGGPVKDRLNSLEITDIGEYYLKTVSGYFEYLAFMKDDVEFPGPVDIRDCVKVADRDSRYREVAAFLEFLFEREKEFLSGLTEPQRQLFRAHFSRPTDDNVFTIATAVDNMESYGRERQLDTSRFKSLARRILEYNQAFLPQGEGQSAQTLG